MGDARRISQLRGRGSRVRPGTQPERGCDGRAEMVEGPVIIIVVQNIDVLGGFDQVDLRFDAWEAVREQTDLLRTSLIGHIFRLFSFNMSNICLK